MIYILTNNPRILALYPNAQWIAGKPLDVLSECRRKVQVGYLLLTHPLMGDIHLLVNPFRTAILGDKKEDVDTFSLQLIEESIEKILSVTLKPKEIEYLDDYQIIDFELVRTVMNSEGVIRNSIENNSEIVGLGCSDGSSDFKWDNLFSKS